MAGSKEFQLTERMQMIASHAGRGEVTADVGTDHGYIPIWLLLNGITDRVILSDVNQGPLDKAASNFEKWLPGVRPDLRLGSGLSVLSPGEAQNIIIAGMGGILIRTLLEDDPEVFFSADRLIFQPRTHSHTLRSYLRSLDEFLITEEEIALEAGRFCEIITLTSRRIASEEDLQKEQQTKEREKEIGLEERIYEEIPVSYVWNDRSRDYLDYKIGTELRVVESIRDHGSSEHADQQRQRAEQRLEAFRTIRNGLERMEQNG